MPVPVSTGAIWTFQQLANGINGKPNSISLSGWSAPFGRPRRSTIVNAGTTIRNTVTYYPGPGAIAPTVHTFGSERKPFVLNGRWMDFAMSTNVNGAPLSGVGSALAFRNTWRDFIDGQVIVRATWGDMLSYQIFIHDFDAEIEGPGDLKWQLTAHALVDENSYIAVDSVAPKTPIDFATQMSILYLGAKDPFTAPQVNGNLAGMLSQFTDALETIIAEINAPFSYVYQTCQALSSFESALSSDLGRLSAGISIMNTGLLNLMAATDLLVSAAKQAQAPNFTQLSDLQSGIGGTTIFSGADMTQLAAAKIDSDAQAQALQALLAYMQLQIQSVQRGQVSSVVIAGTGESWEAMATRTLGSPDAATAIRDMNGIKYGAPPVAGRKYQIPRSA